MTIIASRHKHKPPHRADIVAAIRRKGKTLASLAAEGGVEKHVFYNALNTPHSVSGELAIAEFLEVDPRGLWPERWVDLTPVRELWLLKNAEKLESWRGNNLNDVGR